MRSKTFKTYLNVCLYKKRCGRYNILSRYFVGEKERISAKRKSVRYRKAAVRSCRDFQKGDLMYRHKTKKYRAAAVGAVLAAVLMLGFAGCDKLPTSSDSAATAAPTPTPEPEDLTVFAEGTTMDGIDISGMKLAEAEKVCRAAALKPYANINVTVKSGDTEMTAKGSELTVVDTLDITLTRLLKSRKAGDYEMTYCLTLKNFENELKQRLGDFVVQAKDATVGSYDFDAGDFMFEDAVNGKKLDVYGTLAAVKAQFLKKTSGEVEAALQETAAKVTVDDLRKDFGMISSFETVSTNTENGNHNMGLALSRVNGTVLNPGDTFSYENIVGDSTNASTGFLPAGGLSGGALVQMYGGGICQASSTIYGAALRAGMTITMRDCHSSPSTYVPIGLDATVSYGEIDFQFRNDLDTPVYIMSWMDGVTLHVQFYGKHPKEWDTINVYSQTTSEIPPLDTVKYVVDQNLKKGEKVLSTSGNWGYEASAWRDFVKDGEVIRTETLPSSYYGPSGTIYRIGPGTETSSPSPTPTATPTAAPTATPAPTAAPTAAPTPEPTPAPTAEPTAAPTEEPTPEPVTAAETGE